MQFTLQQEHFYNKYMEQHIENLLNDDEIKKKKKLNISMACKQCIRL